MATTTMKNQQEETKAGYAATEPLGLGTARPLSATNRDKTQNENALATKVKTDLAEKNHRLNTYLVGQP
jgi:hypothetical protein